jgi:hypothetical protein
MDPTWSVSYHIAGPYWKFLTVATHHAGTRPDYVEFFFVGRMLMSANRCMGRHDCEVDEITGSGDATPLDEATE